MADTYTNGIGISDRNFNGIIFGATLATLATGASGVAKNVFLIWYHSRPDQRMDIVRGQYDQLKDRYEVMVKERFVEIYEPETFKDQQENFIDISEEVFKVQDNVNLLPSWKDLFICAVPLKEATKSISDVSQSLGNLELRVKGLDIEIFTSSGKARTKAAKLAARVAQMPILASLFAFPDDWPLASANGKEGSSTARSLLLREAREVFRGLGLKNIPLAQSTKAQEEIMKLLLEMVAPSIAQRDDVEGYMMILLPVLKKKLAALPECERSSAHGSESASIPSRSYSPANLNQEGTNSENGNGSASRHDPAADLTLNVTSISDNVSADGASAVTVIDPGQIV